MVVNPAAFNWFNINNVKETNPSAISQKYPGIIINILSVDNLGPAIINQMLGKADSPIKIPQNFRPKYQGTIVWSDAIFFSMFIDKKLKIDYTDIIAH